MDNNGANAADPAKPWKLNVGLFVGGQALSTFGSMMVQYAIIWHVTLKTQSGSMITLFTLAGFLPMLITAPFAGVWADRWNRKLIINLADSAIALASLIAAAFLWIGVDEVGMLLVCAAVRSFGQGVQNPAGGALIPQIVPQDQLTRVSGIQSGVNSALGLAAPAVSGALMAAAPLSVLFLADVLTAAIGIGILFFLVRVPDVPAAKTEGKAAARYFSDLRDGFRYVARHAFILQLLGLAIVFQLLMCPVALLTPLQVTRDFGAEVWRLTAIEMTFAVGVTLGGLALGVWGGFKNRVLSMAVADALFGGCTIMLGVTGNFVFYLTMMAVIGISMPLYNTPSAVMIQTNVEPSMLGRVFSFFMMISGAAMPLGMVFFGPLSDRVSIDSLLIATGIGIIALLIPILCSKSLRAVAIAPASQARE
ncbi:MAG: MFS transporter [Oscillospiraceae bacterium]|jgi:DHA3 family macrolide efflux protein-like MFS transporter|nr:MFS transporter [Oscillospiraceae bacterium]